MAPFLNRCLLTVLALVSLAFTPAFAQEASTGTIRGTVQNASNGSRLKNATVTVKGTNQETVSDEFGEFTLRGLPAGEVTLSASYIGEPTQTATVSVAGGASRSPSTRLDQVLTTRIFS